MASQDTNREVILRYFDLANNEEWTPFAELWHDDAAIELCGGARFEGKEEILAYYPRVLVNLPVHHDDAYAIHVAGDTATVEIAFTGETTDGVPVAFEAVDVFTLRDGRIALLKTWYDMGNVLAQLRKRGQPDRRLASLVRHAVAASPFYRSRLGSLNLTPDDVVAKPTLLPPTTDTQLATAPGELLAVPAREIRQVVTTPLGTPVPLTAADVDDSSWLLSRALEMRGITRGDTVSATVAHPHLPAALSKLRAVHAPDPTTPGLTALIGTARDDGVDVIDLATTTLETAVTGVIAARCREEDRLHAFTDAHRIEISDGSLIVTALGRRGAPVLRYDTGIRAAWIEGACRCGSELPGLAVTTA